jgi:hypothetical protein
MKRLSHVSFRSPQPIPTTHERIQEFADSDGWEMHDDGTGRLWFAREASRERKAVRFYTRVPACCVESLAPVEGPLDVESGKASALASTALPLKKAKR